MTRAFVAVSPPDAVLDAVAARAAGVTIPGRPTTRDQWHVTLQFLGNRADVDAVAAALIGLDAERGTARLGGAGALSVDDWLARRKKIAECPSEPPHAAEPNAAPDTGRM